MFSKTLLMYHSNIQSKNPEDGGSIVLRNVISIHQTSRQYISEHCRVLDVVLQ
jgi:hypothetical protein